jgi:hypothetical protein
MNKHLWSNCRNINVNIFQHKIVYDIPLYNDLIFKNLKVEFRNGSMIITTFQEPIEHHLVKPWYDNPLIESEQLDETDKYSVSHQLVFHEMR